MLVNLHELLRVVHLVFEQQEVGHETDKVVAETHLAQFRGLVKLGVVHAEADDLFVVDDSDQLGPCEEWLVVLDYEVAPLAWRDFSNEESVRLNCRRLVGHRRQDSVQQLVLVQVALEPAIALGVAVEKHR